MLFVYVINFYHGKQANGFVDAKMELAFMLSNQFENPYSLLFVQNYLTAASSISMCKHILFQFRFLFNLRQQTSNSTCLGAWLLCIGLGLRFQVFPPTKRYKVKGVSWFFVAGRVA